MALNRLFLARLGLPFSARAASVYIASSLTTFFLQRWLFYRSWWSGVEQGPPDAIFGLVEAHKKDPRPEKVSLAIGAYRDSEGKPLVLPTVRKVPFQATPLYIMKMGAGFLCLFMYCKTFMLVCVPVLRLIFWQYL